MEVLFAEQKRAEGTYRFPYAGPGIRNYSRRQVSGQTQLNSKIAFYYLGWILEAMRFSLWDLNKNRVLNSETPFDLKFKYASIPEDSYFNLAWQDTIKEGTAASREAIIQNALKNFKEKGCPYKRVWKPTTQELLTDDIRLNVR